MAEPNEPPQSVRVHYLKSPQFRSIHVDGAIGGVGPSGNVNVALYGERIPIPTMQVFDLADGRLGPERVQERAGREGVVRELEANVILSLDAAKALAKWLDQAVKQLELRIAEQNNG